ncbi:hypothetical protein, partial [Streptomyces sp. NPDC086147]|uniref:hypothetical protein n=1 Tax=Streptomyces sp. NPDC086147 TaxID=3155295 RepID=UPI00344D57E7
GAHTALWTVCAAALLPPLYLFSTGVGRQSLRCAPGGRWGRPLRARRAAQRAAGPFGSGGCGW